MASISTSGVLVANTATTVSLDQWTDGVRFYARTADIWVSVPTRFGAAPPTATVAGDDMYLIPAGDADGRVLPTPAYNPGENDQDAPVQFSIISAGAAGYTLERP